MRRSIRVPTVSAALVLYAEAVLTADNLDDLLREPEYKWEVSEELVKNVNRFINEYNSLLILNCQQQSRKMQSSSFKRIVRIIWKVVVCVSVLISNRCKQGITTGR